MRDTKEWEDTGEREDRRNEEEGGGVWGSCEREREREDEAGKRHKAEPWAWGLQGGRARP